MTNGAIARVGGRRPRSVVAMLARVTFWRWRSKVVIFVVTGVQRKAPGSSSKIGLVWIHVSNRYYGHSYFLLRCIPSPPIVGQVEQRYGVGALFLRFARQIQTSLGVQRQYLEIGAKRRHLQKSHVQLHARRVFAIDRYHNDVGKYVQLHLACTVLLLRIAVPLHHCRLAQVRAVRFDQVACVVAELLHRGEQVRLSATGGVVSLGSDAFDQLECILKRLVIAVILRRVLDELGE
mmetsp:Transcript_49465/g.121437  ORF Transcript_49465/g.121437 Transcript_49465/m.121437 type:complete len:235 (+) Transcript_49465:121-825(+)